MSPIDRPLKRVERAKLHLDDLNGEIERFFETDPYPTTREPHPKKGGYRFRIHIKAAVPDSFGLIFGDFVHNLRASLDNLVYELAVRNRGKLSFPVYRDRTKFAAEFEPLLRGSVSRKAFQIIEGVQPYHATEASDPRNRLALLNSFWNLDKHRTTVPTLAASHMAIVGGFGDVPNFVGYFGDISDGKIVGWMPPGQPNMEYEPHFSVDIRFRKNPLVIAPSLVYFYNFVREEIFGAFERP